MDFPFTGVIPVDKPAGVTSRRVVDVVARAAGMKSVGHAGTLDPLASGVVVVCLGHATRLVDSLHAQTKRYDAVFLLGRSSPSDDLETLVTPEENPRVPSREEIDAAAAGFRGDILQRPCDYSAVHVDGKRAYALARKGRTVELQARPVRIERLVVTAWEWPRLAIDVECSAGTFIRAIGRDLARALGTTAVMETLRRTRVGPFSAAESVPMDDIHPASLAAVLRPPLDALPHLPRVTLTEALLERAVRGGLLGADELSGLPESGSVVAVDPGNAMVGLLGRLDTGLWRLRPNFRGAG